MSCRRRLSGSERKEAAAAATNTAVAGAVLAKMADRLLELCSKVVRSLLGLRPECGWQMLEAVGEQSLPRGHFR